MLENTKRKKDGKNPSFFVWHPQGETAPFYCAGLRPNLSSFMLENTKRKKDGKIHPFLFGTPKEKHLRCRSDGRAELS